MMRRDHRPLLIVTRGFRTLIESRGLHNKVEIKGTDWIDVVDKEETEGERRRRNANMSTYRLIMCCFL